MKKRLYILSALTAVALGGLGVLSVGKAYAEDTNRYSPLVQRLVDRFKLDTSAVDELIAGNNSERNAQREEMRAQRHLELEAKLTQAVTDGKITEDQKTQILAKIAEMQSAENMNKFGQNDGLTREEREAQREERHSLMEERRADLDSWKESLGVDFEEILGFDLFEGPQEGFGPHEGQGYRQGYRRSFLQE